MTLETEFVELCAADLPALRHHLRADPLIENGVVITAHHARTERLSRPGGAIRPHRNAAHAFHAARARNIVAARQNPLRGKMSGLLARPALPIHSRAGNRFRKS